MALRTPPSWLQNAQHPAENDRNTTTNAIWYSAGVVDNGDLLVSQQGTPAMGVSVAAGRALIEGTQTATQSFYIAFNDAATNVSIASADPTNARIDLIVVTVQDSYYGGTVNNQVIFQAVTGTPSGSPVAPSAPANSLVLARVAVAANATSIVSGNITDFRTFASESDTHITSSSTTADSLTINTIVSQTSRAFRINNSAGAQTFAISPAGVVTFPDGSTQNTAAVYDPNLQFNTQTGTTYTFVVADAQKVVTLNNSSAITATIASNATQALPVGTQITLVQYGTGQVTVVGASSPNPVTIVSTGVTTNQPKTNNRYSAITLIQTSTNNWLAVGDLV